MLEGGRSLGLAEGHHGVGLGAAHGFKFAAWFGRELAALAGGSAPGPHLAPFSITREALRRPADRSAWLV